MFRAMPEIKGGPLPAQEAGKRLSQGMSGVLLCLISITFGMSVLLGVMLPLLILSWLGNKLSLDFTELSTCMLRKKPHMP